MNMVAIVENTVCIFENFAMDVYLAVSEEKKVSVGDDGYA